jgi:hypothetical protein
MRPLAVALVLALTTSQASPADKNEDKAKEAAVAFLKAVKSKKLDAVVKTTSLPFAYRDGKDTKLIKDADEFKRWMNTRLDEIKDADKVPTEVTQVFPFADVKEKVSDAALLKTLEEVLGKDGFVAMTKTADDKMMPILIRIKDGKATVVGLGR